MGLTATFSSGNHGGQRAVGWHCTSWRKKKKDCQLRILYQAKVDKNWKNSLLADIP